MVCTGSVTYKRTVTFVKLNLGYCNGTTHKRRLPNYSEAAEPFLVDTHESVTHKPSELDASAYQISA